MMDATAAALALPALVALGTTVLNVAGWPRGRPDAQPDLPVSILIPARNEEDTIAACVRSALAARPPVLEVVVCDDGSTDRTPEILADLKRTDPRLRVIAGKPLPPGQVGKPHACAQLAAAAQGDLLLYLDADVVLQPEGLARIASLLRSKRADVVSAVPRQLTGTVSERVLMPLLHLSYVSWLPMPLVWLSRDPRFLAANGQVLAIRAQALREIGGWEMVSREVVDDMALCRLAKKTGNRVVFADGHHIATCRMYQSAREIWEGFSKNLYEGIGGNAVALVLVVALLGATFLAPWVALPAMAAAGRTELVDACAIGVSANVLQRSLLAWRHRQNWASVVLHPLAIAVLVALAINSFRWSARGAIRWSGRVYPARRTREAA